MKEKTGYFEESPGVKSSTRLDSFLLLLFLFIFDTIWLINGGDEGSIITNNFILLNFLWLIGVFSPKYLHKLAELKNGIIKK